MYKILPILIVGIFIISGLGAVATPEDNGEIETRSIYFSNPTVVDQNEYLNINMKEANSFIIKEGKPLLPSYVHTFTFPLGTQIKGITCSPNGIKQQTISKDIIPSPKAYSADFSMNNEVSQISSIDYGENPYPNKWYSYDIGRGIFNNKQSIIVKVQVFPVQYQPANNIIKWASSVDINVEYKDSVEPAGARDEYKFVIIGPSEYSDELAPLITHKIGRGISTIFVSLMDAYTGVHFPATGRDDQEKIKYFIKNAIENWNTEFVMLVGGVDKLPVRETHVKNGNDEEIFISDLYYADIYNDTGGFCSWDSNENDVFGELDWGPSHNTDEVDLYPDVYLGRLACVNGNEVTTCVNKIQTYENNEVFTKNWFNKLVVIGGDHAPGDPEAVDEGEFVNKKVIEIMAGFIPDRIWDSNKKLSGLFPTGVMNINNAINAGCGFVEFAGHGNTNVWATHPHEDEENWIPTPGGYYLNFEIKKLSNGNKLPIVIVGACSTFKFNKDPDCFGWSFLLNNNGGGIAACGASGLDWFYLGEYVTEKGFEKLCIDSFQAYKDGAMTFGEMWSGAINSYIYPGMDALDHKTVEEFQPFGDPTLAIRSDSQPPNKPTTPSGPSGGKVRTKLTYTTSAVEPEGDQVYYMFDWGDGTKSGWIGPFSSGETGSAEHAWTTEDTFTIRAVAKDENGAISVRSDPLTVTIPRNKVTSQSVLQLLLERIQNRFPLLENLLNINFF
jgi:hypothetical protein